ncbi:O-acetylserine/cysteine efflux transporter [Thermomonospora echinospora]|uniref:O-acetylserine/cysteine efflux transporter n=1 Tax=Thermomonospora echinospora TaxID=1992 RepID=A0A1H5Z1L1_9ACTN|nr:EamA family transporter [Thermomonospora echinospora]SEG29495.1 O-acetylserine/cysteine efflux transporter [Thermomonospora echinospora]
MRPRDVLLATLIAAIWGFNFVVIEVGLDSFPPLLFAALRFVAAAVPAVFFLRRPRVPVRWLWLVGLPLGVGQFGLLFLGMRMGMPAGLSSLVLQTQALFTIVFAGLLLRERLGRRQAAGMLVAFGGVALIGLDFGQGGPLPAFVLCVVGASMWGLANVAMRRMNQTAAEPVDALAFMVWMSLVPPLPLLALSLVFEGPAAGLRALTHLTLTGVGSLAYIAYLSTLVGFGLWGWLMRRYEAGTVAMYSLLVPPFGIVSAMLVLGERVGAVRWLAAVLVIGGVAAGSVRRSRPAPPPPAEHRPDGDRLSRVARV